MTGETFGFGSLAETGFSIQSALAINASRFVLLYIEPDVSEELKAQSPEQADASRRARKLALAHLKKVTNPNVFVATSMADMLHKAFRLYAALELLDGVREGAATWRSSLSPGTWLELVLGAGKADQPASEKSTA